MDPCRKLELGQALGKEGEKRLFVQRAVFLAIDDRDRDFAQPFVRNPEYAGFGNRRMSVAGGLDFLAADILAAANDDVLLAVDDEQIAVPVEIADIASALIMIGSERRSCRLRVFPIALDVGGRADRDFAAFPVRQVPVALTEDRQLDIRRLGAAG